MNDKSKNNIEFTEFFTLTGVKIKKIIFSTTNENLLKLCLKSTRKGSGVIGITFKIIDIKSKNVKARAFDFL